MGRPRGSKYFDMVSAGDSFGKWTITGTPFTDKKSNALIECECECGIKNDIQIYRLVNEKSTQCRNCAAGISPTLGAFSNRAMKSHLSSVGFSGSMSPYSLNEVNLSESFSIQSSNCALTGEAISFTNSAPVPYDSAKGLVPDNTIIVSNNVKEHMGGMDAKTFVNMCLTVADNSVLPKETKPKNVSVKDFFNRREQQ